MNRRDYIYGFNKSLTFNKYNSYTTKYAALYSHQLSKIIFHINESLLIGRITNQESFFVNNNANLTIKTFLFDEFDLLQQMIESKLLSRSNFFINLRNITSYHRTSLVIKALIQKTKAILLSACSMIFGIFIAVIDLILLRFKKK